MVKSLIPTDGRAELEAIQREKHERALRNLVTGVTPPGDFPGEAIPRRPARGGASVQYVPGWWFTGQANALWGYMWDFEVLDQGVGKEQIWVKGKVTVKVRGETVIERRPDGTVIETRSDPMEVSKTQYGGSDIKKKKNSDVIIDIGDDLKSAATDSKKKCLTEFGFASDIYGRREADEVGAVSSQQLDSLYKVGEGLGWNRDKVIEYVVEESGKKPEELETLAILGMINQLREMGEEQEQ